MNSRMEKYNEESFMSRTQKNENLYSSLDMSDLSRIKTNNNISIISDAQKQIDIEKIKRYIYNEEEKEEQKRIKLDLPDKKEETLEKKDEKDYDILSVLQRAKSTRSIEDYENNRHRKINNSGYEILNKLKIEDKQEDSVKEEELNTEEKTIVNLIHTIAINSNKSKEEDDLFGDLMSGNEDTKVLPIISEHEIKPNLTEELKNISAVEDVEFNKINKENETNNEENEKETSPKIEKINPEKNEKTMPGIDKSFFTNSLTFNKDDFEVFEELEKKVNKSSVFTKIAVIIIILLLLATITVVLNYILELGWF